MLANKRLPDQLDVAYGPQAIISRFILQGDREARERGIYLSLEHDFEALIDFNRHSPENRAQGKYVEAEPLYQRALAISENSLGPEHPHVATSLNNLAELYRAQGKYVEAEPLYMRSLAIRERALGSEHPDVATGLENYAALLRQTARTDEAANMEARAKAIRAKSE